MSRKRAAGPADLAGQGPTRRVVEAFDGFLPPVLCLSSIDRGERVRCSTASISTRIAFALAEGGLIYLEGLYGDWAINGITSLGEQAAVAYEARRKSLMETG